MQTEAAFRKLVDIVARLRGPNGCPWDREQTPATIAPNMIEETYECAEAISENDASHIKEELGDMILQTILLSRMFEEHGVFDISDVLEGISEKLIRRHPHVFAGLEVKDSAEVLDNWAKIKSGETGRKPKESILDGIPAGLPPLDRALKLQQKAAKAGFDWTDINGVFAKIDEEIAEVKSAEPENQEAELGDLLFMAINLCRFMKVDPSMALINVNSKFTRRFNYIEKRMKETGAQLCRENWNLMDDFWYEAKEKLEQKQ